MSPLAHESIARALDHHGVTYRRPTIAKGQRLAWLVTTSTGTKAYSDKEVSAYCEGLAERERIERTRAHELVPTIVRWPADNLSYTGPIAILEAINDRLPVAFAERRDTCINGGQQQVDTFEDYSVTYMRPLGTNVYVEARTRRGALALLAAIDNVDVRI